MQMIPVRSSAIRAIGYEPDTRRMKIAFAEGHSYDFCRVPQHVYDAFMRASSKGTYYNDHIRDRYQC
jgi:hypothetical protein